MHPDEVMANAVSAPARSVRHGAVDVAIVGGGIIGTAAALELARAGASVTVLESTAIGAGASGRNSGSVQHPFDEILAPLHRATVERYLRLAEEAPGLFDFPERPAGLLLVASDADVPALEAERATAERLAPDLQPTLVAPAQLAALEPALAPGLAALRLETGYPIPPMAAVAAFAHLTHAAGTRIEIGSAVRLDRGAGGAVAVRLEDGRTIPAGAILVAAGPWSVELVDPSGRWRPIVRTWGVTVTTRLAAPPRHVIEQAGVASVNRADGLARGRVSHPARAATHGIEPDGHFASTFSLVTAAGVSVVGSTFLLDEPDPGSIGPLLLQRADRFVPGLHNIGVDELRACARPQSLDGRPLVGRVPDYTNVFICAGHGPWGISTGPETARIVADLILGRSVIIPAELDPARYRERHRS